MDLPEGAVERDALRSADEAARGVVGGVGVLPTARHQVDKLSDHSLLHGKAHLGVGGEEVVDDRAVQLEVRELATLVSQRQSVTRADGARAAPKPVERRLARRLFEVRQRGVLQRERGELWQPDVVVPDDSPPLVAEGAKRQQLEGDEGGSEAPDPDVRRDRRERRDRVQGDLPERSVDHPEQRAARAVV